MQHVSRASIYMYMYMYVYCQYVLNYKLHVHGPYVARLFSLELRRRQYLYAMTQYIVHEL